MEIKKEEWTAFAEFIARQSEHMCSQYWENRTYIKCPFSTMERAYIAFQVYQQTGSQSEVKKFYDINVESFNPDYMTKWVEEEYNASLRKEAEIEELYALQEGDCTWQDEWDNYCADREKQIIRIAHELADRHERLSIMQWVSLVYPFYNTYELNYAERCLFVSEYHTQCYLKYCHV